MCAAYAAVSLERIPPADVQPFISGKNVMQPVVRVAPGAEPAVHAAEFALEVVPLLAKVLAPKLAAELAPLLASQFRAHAPLSSPPADYLSPLDAEREYKLPRKTIYRLRNEGAAVPFVKQGGRLRVRRDWLEAWLEGASVSHISSSKPRRCGPDRSSRRLPQQCGD